VLKELATSTFRIEKYYSLTLEEGSRSILTLYPSILKMEAAGSSICFSQTTQHYPSISKTEAVGSS
jgi:hypothetical protein